MVNHLYNLKNQSKLKKFNKESLMWVCDVVHGQILKMSIKLFVFVVAIAVFVF